VVFFDRKRAADFANRRKRGGHLLSKGRFLGAQFTAWLRDGHWLDLGRSANMAAGQLYEGLSRIRGVRIVWPVDANEVFAILPRCMADKLREAGSVFYEWNPESLPEAERLSGNEVLRRLF
jgi:threonine aldolase